MIYDAPGRLEKRTKEPRPETLLLEGNVLTVQRRGQTRVLDLKAYPTILPLVESMRAVLAGDSSALERAFTVEFAGSLSHWMLTLVPRDARGREQDLQSADRGRPGQPDHGGDSPNGRRSIAHDLARSPDPMTARKLRRIGGWLALILLAAAIAAHARYIADLSAFLPARPTPAQRLLVDQLRSGPASRLILIALQGGDAEDTRANCRCDGGAVAHRPRILERQRRRGRDRGSRSELLVRAPLCPERSGHSAALHAGGPSICARGDPRGSRLARRAVDQVAHAARSDRRDHAGHRAALAHADPAQPRTAYGSRRTARALC